MFDELGAPWLVHGCWLRLQDSYSVERDYINEYQTQPAFTPSTNTEAFVNLDNEPVNCYLTSHEAVARIEAVDESFSEVSACTYDGKYLRVLFPTSFMADILKFSIIQLTLHMYYRTKEKKRPMYFVERIANDFGDDRTERYFPGPSKGFFKTSWRYTSLTKRIDR